MYIVGVSVVIINHSTVSFINKQSKQKIAKPLKF